jgi:hypothetical protein
MPAWTAWNCWNGRVPARDRPHPKEIARALGLRLAQVAPWQDHRRRGPSRRVRAQARRLLGEPWGEPGLTVAGHPGWPDVDAADAEAFGLVSVLVTRQERSGRGAPVRLAGGRLLPGVKDVVGPRVMDERPRPTAPACSSPPTRPDRSRRRWSWPSSWCSARSSMRGPWVRARPRLCADHRPIEVVGGPERHQLRVRRQALLRPGSARQRRRRAADAGAFRRAR